MSKKQAISFLKEITKNKQLAEKVNEVVGGQDTSQAKAARLLSLAKKNHFNFTTEDVASAKDELKTALRFEDLREVSGGRNKAMSAFMALTLLTGGLGVTESKTNVESSAMFSRFFGGGKDSGKPAPTGKKGDGKDEEQVDNQHNSTSMNEFNGMTMEELREELLRLRRDNERTQTRVSELNQLRLENQLLREQGENGPFVEVQQMETQRLQQENEKLKKELAVTQKAVERMGETTGNNLAAMTKIQKENEELKQSNAKLLEESKQRGGGWFGFGGGTNNSAASARIAELEEENRQLKEAIETFGEKFIEYEEIIREKKREYIRLQDVLEDVKNTYNHVQNNDAQEIREQQKALENQHLQLVTSDKRLLHLLFPQLLQMVALHMPSCASVKLGTFSGRHNLRFTVYDADLADGEIQLPRVGWRDSEGVFDVDGILTVREDGVYQGDTLLAAFNESGIATLPDVHYLTDYREDSELNSYTLPIQVERSGKQRPRASAHNLFNAYTSKRRFGVLPGHKAACTNTPEFKWQALRTYVNAVSAQEASTAHETSSETNMNNQEQAETNMNITNTQEQADQTESTQNAADASDSYEATQKTYRLSDGRTVPFYRVPVSVEELYATDEVTRSLGNFSRTYSLSEVLSQQPLKGPDDNSVVQFYLADADYSIDPTSGDVTWTAQFDARHEGATTMVEIPLLSVLRSVPGYDITTASHPISLIDKWQETVKCGAGLIGQNGQKGDIIVKVALVHL